MACKCRIEEADDGSGLFIKSCPECRHAGEMRELLKQALQTAEFTRKGYATCTQIRQLLATIEREKQ